MSFTDRMWSAAGPVYEQILAHPFLTELTDGSLSRDRFSHYVIQDVKYISEFVRLMAATGANAPDRTDVAMLTRRAGEVAAEHELHQSLCDDLGISDAEIDQTPMAPTCRGYLDFLYARLHTAPFLEAFGAILACPWVYWEVGKHLLDQGSPDPLYQRWIERYGGETAAMNVPPLLELAERAAADASPAVRQRAIDNFLTGCRYEWMFWDMGYTGQTWPV